ncbi:hypothetical protein NEUTE1DRAFT_139678 [Neurospora tetrasperma FGSC 2508]|uniref:Uncharacterized protein n=1 Tax=Neurospora tetrasperma (strain FGSC 2508 / ATCC MYA-4615 / P0657) TaxID=510951 RepID=F8MTS3_NEUT8|nr:uncharacterized protein NEUTE1DRAFT_139678 [Neurospora tetrasperma FGSC 2508]EGO55405.1 hypothetical protein NEUTE1DRAFT_139678 [Neurospora tetrasperma FGSC 2508]
MRSVTGCNNSHCPASKATYPRTCDKKVESEGRVSRRQTGTQNDAVNRQSLISMILQKQQVDVGRDMTNHHRQREFMKIPNGMTQCILLLNPHSLSSHPRSVLNVSLCNDKFATREESMRRTCTNDIVHAAR